MLPKETSEFIEQKLINVTDKVTVIVPVYNVSSFLSKCIESICEQEYPFLEIILVDDGSRMNLEKYVILMRRKMRGLKLSTNKIKE